MKELFLRYEGLDKISRDNFMEIKKAFHDSKLQGDLDFQGLYDINNVATLDVHTSIYDAGTLTIGGTSTFASTVTVNAGLYCSNIIYVDKVSSYGALTYLQLSSIGAVGVKIQCSAFATTLAVWDSAGNLSNTGNIYLNTHGIGNDASVLTFASTSTGKATFAGDLDITGKTLCNFGGAIYIDVPAKRVGIYYSTPDYAFTIKGNLQFIQVAAPIACVAVLGMGAGNIDNGAHRYSVTYINYDGETDLGAWSNTITVSDKTANGKINLSSIPVSSDAKVLQKQIFRTKVGNLNSAFLLATIANNVTTYADNTADIDLGVSGYRKENTTAGQFYIGYAKAAIFGIYNTSFGYNALNNNTTGNSLTAIGSGALYSNTVGNDSVAIGYDALYLATGSEGCVAIGYAAILNSIVPNNCVAIGTQALREGITLKYCVAVGNDALIKNDGDYNTAIGYQAEYYNVDGTYLTAIGYQAGKGVTGNSHSNNVLVGALAGTGITTGSNNIFIGKSSGENCTSGGTNIIIAYDVDLPTASTSNYLNLGGVLTGNTSTLAGNIVGDFSVATNKLTVAASTGNTVIAGSLSPAGFVDFTGSNIIWVPLTGNIQTYVDNAADGDTLILAAGEYVITSTITITKQLNIMGQGNAGFVTIVTSPGHGTLISSSTSLPYGAFHIKHDNVRLAHLSINLTGAASLGINIGDSGTAVTDLLGIVLTNIDIIVLCTGYAQGFTIYGCAVVMRNLTFFVTSTNSTASGVWFWNDSTTTQNSVCDCFNVTGTCIGKAAAAFSYAFVCENYNGSKSVTLNLHNSVCKSYGGTLLDVAVACISTTTFNAIVNAYLCTFDGLDYDAYVTGTNALNLGGSVLVNNLVFGPVTYRAAIAAGIGVFGTTLNTGGIITSGGNIYMGANGLGNNAGVLTFAAGATGLATFAGAVRSTGNFDVATTKLTVAAATGNTAIAGTLNVSGLSRFGDAIAPTNSLDLSIATGALSTPDIVFWGTLAAGPTVYNCGRIYSSFNSTGGGYDKAQISLQLPTALNTFNDMVFVKGNKVGAIFECKMGINTSAPEQIIHAVTTHTDIQFWIESGASRVCGFRVDDTASLAKFISSWRTGGAYNMAFEFGTVTKMVLTTTGQLVINDTAVTSGMTLDVNGKSNFRDDLTIISAKNIVLSTTTGTKIATGATQLMGFWNATPVDQPALIAVADGSLASVTAQFNLLLASMKEIGLIASA